MSKIKKLGIGLIIGIMAMAGILGTVVKPAEAYVNLGDLLMLNQLFYGSNGLGGGITGGGVLSGGSNLSNLFVLSQLFGTNTGL